jgi:hypothetical protein
MIGDLIAEICEDCNIGPDEPFAFSAIMAPTDNDCYKLKINCLIPATDNPYTVRSLVEKLYDSMSEERRLQYVQPPFELWLKTFKPFLIRLVDNLHSEYKVTIPDREEMISILYYTIAKLYTKGYYLHAQLIRRSYRNELNMECRKLRPFDFVSLETPIGHDDDGKELTLLEQIVDPSDAEREDEETRQELFEKIKARMLQDMSPLAFDRILIQLKSGTIDRSTSYLLNKYRGIFNPGYTPRPNAKGKNKGGKRV